MNIRELTLGIIGAGRLGECLIKGWLSRYWPRDKIIATRRNTASLQELKRRYKIAVTTDNSEAATADLVILAVKPAQIQTVLQELHPVLIQHKPIIISTAAGIPYATLQRWVGDELTVVRAMPNTPTQLGYGLTGLFAPLVDAYQKQKLTAVFQELGEVLWLDSDEEINHVAALASSGVALYFRLMRAFTVAGEKLGVSVALSEYLTNMAAMGAAQLARESKLDLQSLEQQVASKGGTTEQSLKILEEAQIDQLCEKALAVNLQRIEEMTKEWGDYV